MTAEEQWLQSDDALSMALSAAPIASDRKFRLLACACCRALLPPITNQASLHAIAICEAYADLLVTRHAVEETSTALSHELFGTFGRLRHEPLPPVFRLFAHEGYNAGLSTLRACLECEAPSYSLRFWTLNKQKRRRAFYAALVRDVVGNPFRSDRFSLEWRTDTALALARQMYESRDFSAMPILADALQDAGCDNDDILSHCRGAEPHVRGCWVIDLVLGKQ